MTHKEEDRFIIEELAQITELSTIVKKATHEYMQEPRSNLWGSSLFGCIGDTGYYRAQKLAQYAHALEEKQLKALISMFIINDCSGVKLRDTVYNQIITKPKLEKKLCDEAYDRYSKSHIDGNSTIDMEQKIKSYKFYIISKSLAHNNAFIHAAKPHIDRINNCDIREISDFSMTTCTIEMICSTHYPSSKY